MCSANMDRATQLVTDRVGYDYDSIARVVRAAMAEWVSVLNFESYVEGVGELEPAARALYVCCCAEHAMGLWSCAGLP